MIVFTGVYSLREGDIVLTPDQERDRSMQSTQEEDDPFGPQNAVVADQDSTWPNGQVPYVLSSSLSE